MQSVVLAIQALTASPGMFLLASQILESCVLAENTEVANL